MNRPPKDANAGRTMNLSQTLTSGLRWILVLPAAVVVVLVVDGAVVTLLNSLGIEDRSMSWILGKMVGHSIMGAFAILVGTWMAPAHQRATALTLLGVAALVAIRASVAGALPLRIILPLAAAFLLGAAIGTHGILGRVHRGSGGSSPEGRDGPTQTSEQ